MFDSLSFSYGNLKEKPWYDSNENAAPPESRKSSSLVQIHMNQTLNLNFGMFFTGNSCLQIQRLNPHRALTRALWRATADPSSKKALWRTEAKSTSGQYLYYKNIGMYCIYTTLVAIYPVVTPIAGLLSSRPGFENIFKTQGIFKIKERFQVLLE